MISPHIINNKASIESLVKWNPPLILLLDPDVNYLTKIRAALPSTKIVVRIYIKNSDVETGIMHNPIGYAVFAHQLTLSKYGHVLDSIDYVQIANEVLQDYNGINALVEFELHRMKIATYKCGIFAFSVGNPDLPMWSNQLLPALKYANDNGHCVVIHQYSKPPSMWEPDPDWHIHRLEHKVLPIINSLGLNNLKFAVTEYGLDDLLYGDGVERGWSKFIDADDYTSQLINIGKYIHKFSDKVYGYCVFTLGHNPPWGSYDIAGEVEDKLVNYYSQNPIKPKWRDMNKKRVTAMNGLNVRSEPNTSSNIIAVLKYNEIIDVESYNTNWSKYNGGYVYTAYLSDNLSIISTDPIAEFATKHNIDVNLLLALANIESGDNYFINDRLIIRLEAHLLLGYNNKFNQTFSFNPANRYFEHFFLGKPYHGNQDKEWNAFNFALSRDKEATYKSTSYGKYQILGANYNSLGFDSAEALFNYLNESEHNQDIVFLTYLDKFGMIPALQSKDFRKITEKYNGSGNVDKYSVLLENEYKRLSNIDVEEKIPVDKNVEAILNNLQESVAELQLQMKNLSEFVVLLSNEIDKYHDDDDGVIVIPDPDPEPNVDISSTLKPYFNSGVMQVTHGVNYKAKEIFTVQDGSWDVSDKKFSIEQRFRDRWLKPVNDPKYVSTGDHSITVIIVDKDGNRLGNVGMQFISNGNPPLIVNRQSKNGSGYENLILYGGQNFGDKPGPWTAKVGGAFVSGLGMYKNWHISTVIVFEKQ